jgi:hypothetical protein
LQWFGSGCQQNQWDCREKVAETSATYLTNPKEHGISLCCVGKKS